MDGRFVGMLYVRTYDYASRVICDDNTVWEESEGWIKYLEFEG